MQQNMYHTVNLFKYCEKLWVRVSGSEKAQYCSIINLIEKNKLD